MVRASEVVDGQPRVWTTDDDRPVEIFEQVRRGEIHLAHQQRAEAERVRGKPATYAVVGVPLTDAPTNEHTLESTRGEKPWREMVWRQAFTASLGFNPNAEELADVTDEETERLGPNFERVKWAAEVADLALVEWAKRWQR